MDNPDNPATDPFVVLLRPWAAIWRVFFSLPKACRSYSVLLIPLVRSRGHAYLLSGGCEHRPRGMPSPMAEPRPPQDTSSTKALVTISRPSFAGFGQVRPWHSTAERQKTHPRRDRPTIRAYRSTSHQSPAADDTKNGVSLSGARPLSMLRRNTLYQTKTSWSTNGFGAFVVSSSALEHRPSLRSLNHSPWAERLERWPFVRTPPCIHYRAMGPNCSWNPRSVQINEWGAQPSPFTIMYLCDQHQPHRGTLW